MSTTYTDTNISQLVINKMPKEVYAGITPDPNQLYLLPEPYPLPTGVILPYGGASAPDGFLLCDGSPVSRTDYAGLFATIGTTFGTGDGSTTFNIPDLRETLPVGAGTSTRAAISDHDTYDIGQFKDDQLQDHYHQNIYTKVGGVQYELTYYSRETEAGSSAGSTVNGDKKFYTGGVATLYRSGTTTHGKQLGVNYIIKY